MCFLHVANISLTYKTVLLILTTLKHGFKKLRLNTFISRVG